ncbi:BafA family autotransporter [Bartonella krasnovii]|uniref:Autotransporter outer membrane beta-barrel domain-containing protein n=1 Tax=Bartonella krasnovii TaxID=2267275 RepID=A0A5B9D008_9HYPH|nr:BafA family autotransporter [Bartonella krasnovii]QEE11847.1 autotransporter outer membrane beta-barrel domain-containing protein [Bartonella krasnovii]UNF42660.1 BafA family autotransporter [Bartonella krasnovii]UNF47547.1 BafA family autotransporter [Bartonella krasnovii]UNF54167.1 BafA family autotransporter [Bartonella krasnovii]UNF55872.1 BafA family autotransporter [Bartonella krasnovii]
MVTQYKWKRNFWVLLLSSCFVQAAAANEGGVPLFCQSSSDGNDQVFHDQYNEDMKTGRCILGASNDFIVRRHNELGLLKKPSNFTLVKGARIFASQQELDSNHHDYVGDNARAQNTAFLKKPELIFIKDGALLENYVLDHEGKAYISNDGEIDSPGRSINNTVKNGAELYVYAGGLSENSKIEHGGIENVQALKGKQGFSKNAVVKEGGKQSVGNGGKVEETKIYGGEQLVFGEGDVGGEIKGSSASHTVIYGQEETLGQQKVYDGGKVWNTKVMRGGIQEVGKKSEGAKNGGFAFDTEVFAGGKQRILKGGQAIGVTLNESATQEIYTDGSVKSLTMNDETKSWVHAGAILEGKTQVNHSGQLHLYAGNEQHRTTVEDILLNGKETKLYSLTDESDGKSSLIRKLSGEGSVIFEFTGSDPYYSQLHVNNLSGSLHFALNTTIAQNRGDYLFVEKGTGNHTISVADSGVEITDPFSNKRDLITDQSGGAHFTLTDLKGENINALDGGTYMYGLKERKDENGKVWFLSADRLSGPENSTPDPTNPFIPGGTLTTPSTDAVLTLSVVPGLIFNNELQIVRNGRKIWNRNRKDIELWTYGIKSRERIATGHTHFKLGQTGLVFGADQLNELRHGELYIGGFGSYDQARVSHARGGRSDLSSYSIGTYATYFDHRGWYMDGVLKYNYYQDNLKAISTNGLAIQSHYNQWAIGGSFEIGCYFEPAQNTWMQPYIKLTGLQVEGKKIKLSNGMTGDLSPLISFRSEVGLTAGHEFFVNSETSLTAYIMAAWLRENINNNHAIINNQHKFITDLSGSAGKLGIGLNSLVNDNLTLYAEAYYLKGHKIKNALQGILGLRYSF